MFFDNKTIKTAQLHEIIIIIMNKMANKIVN